MKRADYNVIGETDDRDFDEDIYDDADFYQVNFIIYLIIQLINNINKKMWAKLNII